MNTNTAIISIGVIAAVTIAAQVVYVAWLSLWGSTAAAAAATILVVVVVEALVTCRLVTGGWL